MVTQIGKDVALTKEEEAKQAEAAARREKALRRLQESSRKVATASSIGDKIHKDVVKRFEAAKLKQAEEEKAAAIAAAVAADEAAAKLQQEEEAAAEAAAKLKQEEEAAAEAEAKSKREAEYSAAAIAAKTPVVGDDNANELLIVGSSDSEQGDKDAEDNVADDKSDKTVDNVGEGKGEKAEKTSWESILNSPVEGQNPTTANVAVDKEAANSPVEQNPTTENVTLEKAEKTSWESILNSPVEQNNSATENVALDKEAVLDKEAAPDGKGEDESSGNGEEFAQAQRGRFAMRSAAVSKKSIQAPQIKTVYEKVWNPNMKKATLIAREVEAKSDDTPEEDITEPVVQCGTDVCDLSDDDVPKPKIITQKRVEDVVDDPFAAMDLQQDGNVDNENVDEAKVEDAVDDPFGGMDLQLEGNITNENVDEAKVEDAVDDPFGGMDLQLEGNITNENVDEDKVEDARGMDFGFDGGAQSDSSCDADEPAPQLDADPHVEPPVAPDAENIAQSSTAVGVANDEIDNKADVKEDDNKEEVAECKKVETERTPAAPIRQPEVVSSDQIAASTASISADQVHVQVAHEAGATPADPVHVEQSYVSAQTALSNLVAQPETLRRDPNVDSPVPSEWDSCWDGDDFHEDKVLNILSF